MSSNSKWLEKKKLKHTQSSSGPAPGTNTFISLDLAVVIETPKDSLLKYNWQPAVLSTEIVGAEPCIIEQKEMLEYKLNP